jgi:hypothetical protein
MSHELPPSGELLPFPGVELTPEPPQARPPLDPAALEDQAFRLRLELDMEHERLLLLRVCLVMELLGALLLLRTWLLA